MSAAFRSGEMTPGAFRASRWSRAFTLIELILAMALLSLVMVLLAAMVNSVSNVWRHTSGKISSFQSARAGFEAMNRKISQATLNTYWDYEYPNNDTTKPPSAYVRHSELHFISGQADQLLPAVSNVTTHAIFFQAPLGYSNANTESEALQTLLNAAGFFVQRGDDATDRPAFLQTLVPLRTRYRLMEIWQPTENFRVYEPTRAALSTTPALRTRWFTEPMAQTPSPARPLAENVIALILWPRRATTDTRPPISPDFGFNTRAYLDHSSAALAAFLPTASVKLSRNQLPPVVQVTMVAIDEPSAARLEALPDAEKTLLQPGELFASLGSSTAPAQMEQFFQDDLAALTDWLSKHRLNYRLFTTAVTLRQAKWSEQ